MWMPYVALLVNASSKANYLLVLQERDGHEEKRCEEAEQPLLVLSKPTQIDENFLEILIFSRFCLQLGVLLQLQIFRFVHYCAPPKRETAN